MPVPRCSECRKLLVDDQGKQRPAGTKTCTTSCRQKRARRLKQQKIDAAKRSKYSPEVAEVAEAVRGDTADAAHEVLKEELRPLVREAMTADVLACIETLIKLTPAAIEALQKDLSSEDETIRQRAYTLLLKYTMGNPSVAPPSAEQAPAPMQVFLGIPRPGDTSSPGDEADEAVELRECMDCRQHKAVDEFVGASNRCTACFDELREKVAERFDRNTSDAT